MIDQLQGVPDLVARPMFGGVGLYSAETFFGIVANDRLYLKVDDRTRGRYESAGMKPFKPYAHRPTTFRYYEVPVGVLESPDDLSTWAREAVQVAASDRRSPGRRADRVSGR